MRIVDQIPGGDPKLIMPLRMPDPALVKGLLLDFFEMEVVVEERENAGANASLSASRKSVLDGSDNGDIFLVGRGAL